MGTTLDTVLSRSRTQIITCGRTANPFATGALLLAADALAVAASGWLGAQIWSHVNDAVIAEAYLRLWPASIAFLAAYAMLGLYPGVGLSPVEELRRTVIGTTIVYLMASASIFLSKEISFYSRGVFLVCWVSTAVAVPLCRAALRHCCAAKSWWGVPVVVVGAGPAGQRVARNLQAQPELGLKPVAFLDDDGEAADGCRGWLRSSHAVVAMPGLSPQELLNVLERMTAVFSHVIVIPDLFGMASLWVSARDLGGVLGLEIRQNLLNPVNRWLKRGLDLAVAAVAGVLAAPLVAAAALWIKWSSPGPAFFLQERGGAGERRIRVWKLRTMYRDAAPMLERHLEQHPEDRQEWQQHFKLKQGPAPAAGHRRPAAQDQPGRSSAVVECHPRRHEPGGAPAASQLPPGTVRPGFSSSARPRAARSHRAVAGLDTQRRRPGGPAGTRHLLHPQLVVVARPSHSGAHGASRSSAPGSLLA